MENRKITEADILLRLREPNWSLPPLETVSTEVLQGQQDGGIDAIVELRWNGKSFRFATEVRRLWTPKAVLEASDQAQRNAKRHSLYPLLVVPYLAEERLRDLEARGVSGIDLCGNGVVIVPGELMVFRSGNPNQFRGESQIKNVYRGASAIVARAFLVDNEFASVGDVLERIQKLGGKVTLSTVSKVCKSLEQDLVIERKKASRGLRTLQPEKLLDLLRNNYAPPAVARAVQGKFAGTPESLMTRLRKFEKSQAAKATLSGASSVAAYAVMAREPLQTFYCSDLREIKQALGDDFKETDRFANVRFLETKDEFVYFDQRPGLIASPVQTYLELATGEKREKETAEQVRRVILGKLSAKGDS